MVRVNEKPAYGMFRPVRGLEEARVVERRGRAQHATPYVAASRARSLYEETLRLSHSSFQTSLNVVVFTRIADIRGKRIGPPTTQFSGFNHKVATTFLGAQQGCDYSVVARLPA